MHAEASGARRRDSVKARRICFEAHRTTNHIGRTILICHLNGCIIDPVRNPWRADHIRRWAEDGEDTPENLFPICERCDREDKAPKDTSAVAKGKRMGERHFGIRRATGFRKVPPGYKYDWKQRRVVKVEEE